MSTFQTISFKTETRNDIGGPVEVMPIIDGVKLIDLVRDFEIAKNYIPVGEYGGIIPEYFSYGPLLDYYLGCCEGEYWQEIGGIYVLGCQCGEVGCWPLKCTSEAKDEMVIWQNFSQPHRPQWDYSDFGPFSFKHSEFSSTIRQLMETLPYNC